MKTATIDYADFEVLVGAGVVTVSIMEDVSQKATGDEKEKADKVISDVRAVLERVATGAVIGHRAPSFQDRLTEAIASAKATAAKE
ncbi:MAG: hypothetical protein ACRYG7_13110 [Janthinobacterium lividum]